MAKHESSDSESEEKWSSEELENPSDGSNQAVSEYEKQRLHRISENRARMEALGLNKMASTLMGSVEKQRKYKGKAKVVEEDEEYRPPDVDEEGLSSSSREEDDDDEEDDEFVGDGGLGSRARKVKNKNSKPKKKVSIQKLMSNSDFIDDDDALMQAIALSLEDSAGVSDTMPSQSSDVQVIDATLNERKGNVHIQEDTGRRKRKKSISSRVQLTEDELIVHFFQFDEAGKGGITLRDLRRVAYAHDFTWTDKEMADMIHCFDRDGDGKAVFQSDAVVGRLFADSSQNYRSTDQFGQLSKGLKVSTISSTSGVEQL